MSGTWGKAIAAAVAAVALVGCGGGEKAAPPVTGGSPIVPPVIVSTTVAETTTSLRDEPLLSLPVITLPPAAARVTIGKLDVPVPQGWRTVPGTDERTIDNETVKGSDSLCLMAPNTKTDGIPFRCTGVLILTGTAFDNASEGQTPYNPDSDYQWYPGTDVPSCEPDFPLIRSKIVESGLVPIGSKRAAFRRLHLQCEKRPTVHEAVAFVLPVSKIALVSLFHADDARAVWAGARLL